MVPKGPDRTDVLRSLKRYMNLLLLDADPKTDWDLWIERTDGLKRPAGVIMPTPAMGTTGTAYVRHHQRDYDVFLYPAVRVNHHGKLVELPSDARLRAEALAAEIERRINQGFRNRDGEWVGRSLRLPVYDYTGKSAEEAATEDDFLHYIPMREQVPVEVRTDPEDDRLFTLMARFTLQWSSDGDISRFQGAVLQDVRRTFRIH